MPLIGHDIPFYTLGIAIIKASPTNQYDWMTQIRMLRCCFDVPYSQKVKQFEIRNGPYFIPGFASLKD